MPAALGATPREALEGAIAELRTAGIETARADAEWLLAGLLDVGRAELHLRLDRPLPDGLTGRYRDAVLRRARREPLQQILGWESFRGVRIRLTPDVLVPRPETEALADWALALLPRPSPDRRPLVIDLGTGSGCIACAIARERPDVDVLAIDASPAAAAVARDNVGALGLASRVRVVVGDLFDPVGGGGVDVIVSNPPYVPTAMLRALPPEVSLHEPRIALDGGADGLSLIRRLVAGARRRLRPAGALVLETAGRAQAAEIAALLAAAGFVDVERRRDLAGAERFVGGRAPTEAG